MIRRLITLICVAILSGLAGTVVGVLIAPAPGRETRAQMSIFAERHGHIVTETVEQGRDLVGAVVEFFATRLTSSEDA